MEEKRRPPPTIHHSSKSEMISIIFLLIITITTTSSSATLADADVVEGAHHLGHDHHPHHPHPHDHHPHHYNHHHILICHLSSQSGKGGGKISSTRGVQWLRTLQTRSSGEVLVNLELFRFSILQSRVERLRTVQARCLSSLKKLIFHPVVHLFVKKVFLSHQVVHLLACMAVAHLSTSSFSLKSFAASSPQTCKETTRLILELWSSLWYIKFIFIIINLADNV